MYDVISNLYHLTVSLQMETGNVSDRSNNISVSIWLQNVTDRYGTDQKAIRYNENIVLMYICRNVYFGIIVFNCLSPTKPPLKFLLICFPWEIKGFYQSSLANEVDFYGYSNGAEFSLFYYICSVLNYLYSV